MAMDSGPTSYEVEHGRVAVEDVGQVYSGGGENIDLMLAVVLTL